MSVESYRDLVAWQRAMDLVNAIYSLSRAWPKDELYGLTGQIRRAAVSIASNIAEGHLLSTKDYLRHLSIARGSLAEVETQLLVAAAQQYLSTTEAQQTLEACEEVGRLLTRLSQSIARRLQNPRAT